MSYIQYKEKVFSKKNGLPSVSIFKTKISGRLKCLTPFTDPRAWSLDTSLQRKYFLETINSNVITSSSSSSGNFLSLLPPNFSKKRKLSSMAKADKSRLLSRKVKSAEQLISIKRESHHLEESLAEANRKINRLISEKEQICAISKEYELENNNLRTLVHDVQDEFCFLHSLKAENTVLKAELSSDLSKKIIEAQDEINYLNSQLQLYKDYKCKYENIRSSNDHLKEVYDQVYLSLKETEWNNKQLKNEIESLKAKICGFKSHELVVSNAIVDKQILRERLQMREEKISCLVNFLEEQEVVIQDLVFQLQRMTSNLTTKEDIVGKQMHTLKFSLYKKANRISELEDELHASGLLIRELENLRDHFRLSNCALTENMQNYKKQFNIVVSCSKKLLAEIDKYKAEISNKDVQIQKLSIFPQSALSIVHFAQLLNLLKSSEELIMTDGQNAVSFIPVMRRIVEQLKDEIITTEAEYPLYEMYNSDTQTEILGTDKCVQNERCIFENKLVEASIPDRYYFDYQKSQIEISELQNIIKILQESFHRTVSTNHSLERKIISSVAEKNVKEKEICDLKCQLLTANETVERLKNELEHYNSLLRKSLFEIEIEKGVQESTSEILVATLDTTTYEYSKYISILESHLKYKEEKIKYLEDYLCNPNRYEETPENEYIGLLENEIKHLSKKYINEKQNVKDLHMQISKLQGALAKKMDHFKIVQEQLLKAENIFEHLNNIEDQCVKSSSHNTHPGEITVTPTDEIVVTATNKILSHGERLKFHLEEEKDFKEKLLKETVSKEYVLNLIKRNNFQKRRLKKYINQLRININRIKSILFKIRNKLRLSECINRNYCNRLSKLESYSSDVKKEKDFITDQLHDEKSKIESLEKSLEMKCLELCNLWDEKKNVEKVLIKIIKQLEKKTRLFDVTRQSKAVNTESEFSFKNYENEVANLKMKINELVAKNNSLLAHIANLEERLANILYIPQKDKDIPEISSVEIQTDLSDDSSIIKDVQSHYENVIQILQKDKSMEKEESIKEHTNILNKLKETYEKNNKNIRKAHHNYLSKLQAVHEEEIAKLKSFYQEQCTDHVNKLELQEIHHQELEKQKLHYEALLKSKEVDEVELTKEIKELKAEVSHIIEQKKEDNSIFNEKIKEQLIEVKTKFKKHYKALKKMYESKMLELVNKQKQEINKITTGYNKGNSSVECQTIATIQEEVELSESNNIKDSQKYKENMNLHSNEIHCNKKIDINFKERIQCSIKEANGMIPIEILHILNRFKSTAPSIFGDSQNYPVKPSTDSFTNTPRVSEKYDLVIEKADRMKENFQDMLQNISSYNKHAEEEKAIIQEIRDLLNQERIHSCAVQQRLSYEFNRAEKLKAQKDDLRRQLVESQKYLIEVESDLRLEKEKYENLKKSLASVAIQRRTSEQLEMSLERLKKKIEKAVQCEKRITEELEDDKKISERIHVMIESNKISENSGVMDVAEDVKVTKNDKNIEKNNFQKFVEVTKDTVKNKLSAEVIDDSQCCSKNTQNEPANKTDLKVIFIQRCGVLHIWREQFFAPHN